MTFESHETFDTMKARLDEIADEVNADGISLDDALALYEEAVALGLRASDLLEEGSALSEAEGASSDQETKLSATVEGSDGDRGSVASSLEAAADETAASAVSV